MKALFWFIYFLAFALTVISFISLYFFEVGGLLFYITFSVFVLCSIFYGSTPERFRLPTHKHLK